jgi:hypothetical protein
MESAGHRLPAGPAGRAFRPAGQAGRALLRPARWLRIAQSDQPSRGSPAAFASQAAHALVPSAGRPETGGTARRSDARLVGGCARSGAARGPMLARQT